MQDPKTFDEARQLLHKQHREAGDKVHSLVTGSKYIANNQWPELTAARKAESDFAEDLFRLNVVEAQVRDLAK